jgi:hypothetical protein
LVLVLMNERFSDGTPTDLRYLVQAQYPADQELPALTQQSTALVPMQAAQNLGDVSLTITSARLVETSALPPELAYLVLDMYNWSRVKMRCTYEQQFGMAVGCRGRTLRTRCQCVASRGLCAS